MSAPSVNEMFAEDWQRLRDLRLASRRDSAEAFGGNFDEEKHFTEGQWREKFEKRRYLVVTVDSVDLGVMSVENLIGDFGATCWVGG